jgi:malate dehydrogenase (oxaloacetate-decarboxylating)
MINAIRVVNKKMEDVTIVINGAGSAGMAIAKILISIGAGNIIMCDRYGIIYAGAPNNNDHQEKMAKVTNKENKQGTLADALAGADVFVGVSAPNLVTEEMAKKMNKDAVVFGMANPVPEIMPEVAAAAGVRVYGSGRSDFPNQINNVLVFPGMFRGALDVRASEINEEMKVAAAYAIASIISDEELREDYIIPDAFDPRVASRVAEAVSKAAIETKVARK